MTLFKKIFAEKSVNNFQMHNIMFGNKTGRVRASSFVNMHQCSEEASWIASTLLALLCAKLSRLSTSAHARSSVRGLMPVKTSIICSTVVQKPIFSSG